MVTGTEMRIYLSWIKFPAHLSLNTGLEKDAIRFRLIV